MINRKIFAFCLLAILSLICSQFVPNYHKPLSLEFNHKNRSDNGLNLSFSAEHFGKPITIYRGYAFVFYFPDGSFTNNLSSPKCLVDNEGDVGSFSGFIDTVNSRITCVYDANEATFREGRVLNLNVQTKVVLYGFTLNNTFYNKFRFGLFTSRENGVLLVQTPAFKPFALYEDFATMPAASSLVITSNASISNTTNSLSCSEPPCSNMLYPWSDFSLTLRVSVNSLVFTEEAYLVFKFNTLSGYEDIIPDLLSINSSNVDVPNNNVDQTLYSKLSSSQAGGSLSLERISDYFVISDISKFRSGALANLVPGRTFTLTFSGFNTKRHVGNPAITSVETFVLWKNTASFLSYHSLPLNSISTISTLNFKTANEDAINVQSSFAENFEGSSMSIYESGIFQIIFQIKVPKAEAGKLIITSLNSDTRVFSFIASTCDFSISSSDKNILGSRQKCIPLYSSTNGLERSITKDSNSSGFYIKLNASPNSPQDIKFTVWGLANMCNPDKIYDNSYGNILNNTIGTYLAFKLQLEVDNVVYAEESSFTSRIKCIKNIRDREMEGFMRFYNPKQAATATFDVSKLPIAQLTGHPTNNINKDYVLYEEVTDWKPTVGQSPNVKVLDSNTNSLTVDNFPTYSETTLRDITSSGLTNSTPNFFSFTFGIVQTVGEASLNTIDFYIPLPYTYRIVYNANEPTNKYQHSIQQTEGRYTLTIPSLIASPVNNAVTSGCNLVAFSENTNSDRKFSVFRSNSSNSNYKINVSSNQMTTSTVNNKSDQQDMLVYGVNQFFTTNFHTTCFQYRDYSSYQVKNIYTAASFYLKFDRLFSSSFYENRVVRFFKFFNSSMGFRSNNVIARAGAVTDYIKYFSVDVADSFSANKLCLLHIDEALTNLPSSHNTVLINLLNTRLPFIGEGNSNDYYPVSQLNSGVNALPLYSEAPNDLISQKREAITLIEEQLNGYYDFEFDSFMTPFLGSSIVIYGFSANIGISPDNEIYIPLYCGHKSYLSVQSFNIQTNGDIDKTTNSYLTFGGKFSVKLFDTHNPTNLVSSSMSYNNLLLRFPDYRSSNSNVNVMTATESEVSSFFTAILLTKNIEYESNISQIASSTAFFGQKVFTGNYKSFSINGNLYSDIYFMRPFASDSSLSLENKSINFLRRLNITTKDGSALIQGLGKNLYGDDYERVYYSNSNNSSSIVIKDSKKIKLPTTDNSPISIVSVEPIGTVFRSDDGQQFKITIKIYSDLQVSDASLRLHSSSNFNTRTICVYSTSPKDSDCLRVSEGAFRCEGINLKPLAYTTLEFNCYNVFIGSTGIFRLTTQTAISQTDYIDDNMTTEYTTNFLNINTSLSNVVASIIPKVSKVECVQGRQIGALANCFLQIDLGRPLRINQTVVLTGAVNNLYVKGRIPTCHYMIADQENNLESINFYDVANQGAWFVNTCQIF